MMNMKVNTTEFRTHLSDYLAMVNNEDIIITKQGVEVARLISTKQAKKKALDRIVNIIPSLTDEEVENLKEERRSKL